jgi:hypothetical protein
LSEEVEGEIQRDLITENIIKHETLRIKKPPGNSLSTSKEAIRLPLRQHLYQDIYPDYR